MQQHNSLLSHCAAAFLDKDGQASLLVAHDGSTVWYNDAFADIAGVHHFPTKCNDPLALLIQKAENSEELTVKIASLENGESLETSFLLTISGRNHKVSTKPLNICDTHKLRLYSISTDSVETIAASRSYYRQIMDSQSALIAVGQNFQLTDCNRAFLAFFNVADLSEFNDKFPSPTDLLLDHPECISKIDTNALMKKVLKNKECGIKTKIAVISPATQQRHILHFTINPIEGTQSNVVSMEDITELHNYSHKLHNMNILLEKEVETKVNEIKTANIERNTAEQLMIQQSKMALMGEMIGVIAHQWKQPLSTLSNIVQDIEDVYNCGGMDENVMSTYVANFMEQINFMHDTITGFAGFFKPSEMYKQLNIINLIKSTEKLVSKQFATSTIKIEYNIPENYEEIFSFGDANEFKQIIMNLLVNAKDSICEQRRKTPSRTEGVIKISLKCESDTAIISIEDNGAGIQPEFIGKLFLKYASTKKEKGTGIGLYLCKLLIANMKGEISAENTAQGVKFIIKLPLYKGE